MAEDSHMEVIHQGVRAWNLWREENPTIQPELEGANLEGYNLAGINLSGAKLLWTNLSNANLQKANLRGAHVSSANLEGADLRLANLSTARIHKANLSKSFLLWADFRGTYLARTNLSRAVLWETVFLDTDLTEVEGLDRVIHNGPSNVDYRTVAKSHDLPRYFLVACGMTAKLADCLLSHDITKSTYYTAFISYSHDDSEFVEKLYLDLLKAGVNTWLDYENLGPGIRSWDEIDKEIENREKLVLVCSSSSIVSPYVKDEVTKAFGVEKKRGADIILPIAVDNSIMNASEAWAREIKDSRHIESINDWQDNDEYSKSFEKMLNELRVNKSETLASFLYPILKSCRNLLLKLLGKSRINNLGKIGNDKF